MTPDTIIRGLHEGGVHLEATGDSLLAAPSRLLTDEQRALIREHKPELLAYLREANVAATVLIAAAMRACDHYGDSPEAREQMRRDVLATPLHLRRDLLEHLRDTYPREAP